MKVYWAVSNHTQGFTVARSLYLPPEPLTVSNTLDFLNSDQPKNNFRICPAYKDSIKNTFALKFPIDLSMEFSDLGLSSTLDQRVFDDLVFVRDPFIRFVGFGVRYTFFSEQSLTMSLTPPFLSDNDLARESWIVPGEFNIGTWFRNTDCAAILRSDTVKIKRGDDYSYVRFHTEEPIELQKFEFTPELARIQGDLLASKVSLIGKSPKLKYYYDLFKNSCYKSRIIKEIKNNLLD